MSTVKADDIRHNQNKMFHIIFGSAKEVNLFRNEPGITVSYSAPEKHIAEVGIHDSEINTLINALSNITLRALGNKFTLEVTLCAFMKRRLNREENT